MKTYRQIGSDRIVEAFQLPSLDDTINIGLGNILTDLENRGLIKYYYTSGSDETKLSIVNQDFYASPGDWIVLLSNGLICSYSDKDFKEQFTRITSKSKLVNALRTELEELRAKLIKLEEFLASDPRDTVGEYHLHLLAKQQTAMAGYESVLQSRIRHLESQEKDNG